MATKNHNLSKFDSPLPSAADMRFGIVVAEWNREVTEALLEGAVRTLRAVWRQARVVVEAPERCF